METPSGNSATPRVISLVQYDQKLIFSSFLAQVASGLSTISFVLALAFLIIGHVLTDIVLVPLFVFCSVWAWAVANVRRRLLLTTSVIVFLLILLFAALVVLMAFDDAERANRWSSRQLNGLDARLYPQLLLALASQLVSVLLAWRLLSDGWRLAMTPPELRNLFTTADGTGRGMTRWLSVMFGVHPVCRWLPAGRRLRAVILFVLAAVFGGMTVFTALSTFLGLGGGLAGCAVLAAITGLFRYLARRSARISARDLQRTDKRPPVLFLRSFKDDQIDLASPKLGIFRGVFGLGSPSRTIDDVLLDEFTPLGPVVAIGAPGSPPPFGAARTYTDADEWQQVIETLARDAAAIIVVVDDTPGVTWEMSHIVDKGHSPKSLYLLPPRLATRSKEAAEFIRQALTHNQCTLAGPLDEPCIGWYRSPQGETVLLTDRRASWASYVCACRLFRRQARPAQPPNTSLQLGIAPGKGSAFAS